MEGNFFNEHHIDGLLHLGALATALTLGYIGLDKEIRGSLARLNPILEKIRSSLIDEMKNAYLAHDVTDNQVSDDYRIDFEADGRIQLFPKYWVYLACILTDYPFHAYKWRRFWYSTIRQIHIPFFIYYKSLADFYVTVVLCFLCLSSFSILTAAELWTISFVDDLFNLKCIFCLYIGTIFWLLFSLLFLARLIFLKRIGVRCIEKIKRHSQLILEDELQRSQIDVKRKLGGK